MPTPVIKWIGGKTQLLPIIRNYMPKTYNNYYEPFVGGGSVFLDIMPTRPKRVFINDINRSISNLYGCIKTGSEKLIELLDAYYKYTPNTEEAYYAMRDKYNAMIQNNDYNGITASLMIWLNKNCFNGLYRVNRKGLFNAAWNHTIIEDRDEFIKLKQKDYDNIREVGKYLYENNVTVMNGDFEFPCPVPSENDFVYIDSPYIPESKTANFTKYTKDMFNMVDHERLVDYVKFLTDRGAKVMCSNNDVPLVHELYKDFNIISFPAKRKVNRDASKRTGQEVLITNYTDYEGE